MAWQANVESTLAEIESARQSAAVFAALRDAESNAKGAARETLASLVVALATGCPRLPKAGRVDAAAATWVSLPSTVLSPPDGGPRRRRGCDVL